MVDGSAVDLERGPSEANSHQASFKERVIECSEEVCLLADATKLGRRSAFFYTGLDRIDTLVTDLGADQAFVEEMAALGVATVVAE